LITGTSNDVKAYVKKLIDVFGKNGDLIIDAGAIIDEAKTENVKTMIDFIKECSMNQ
jgi:hypothetical protein